MTIRNVRRAGAAAATVLLLALLGQPISWPADAAPAMRAARSAAAPATLKLVTFNRGDHATYRQVRDVVDDADAAVLQEMYDQACTVQRLRKLKGYGVVAYAAKGDRCADGAAKGCAKGYRGACAGPVVYKTSKLRLIRRLAFTVLTRRYIGPGAGPDHNMRKWFVGGLFRHLASGRRLIIGSIHNIPSQTRNDLRKEAARTFTRNLVKGLDGRSVLTIVGGDWNATPGAPSLAPVRKADWHFHARRATEHHRPIDFFVWDDRDRRPHLPAKVVRVRARTAGSDHKALFVTWRIPR